jgi:formylmethanofuran dehydrogenase subunit E
MANMLPYSQASKNEITMVGSHTFDEFVEEVRHFHSYPAPGVVLGGFMVEKAKAFMPKGILYNAIAETFSCLPDAIQLLTPCTVGNGWLKIIRLGHFALSLYDKNTGEGVRTGIDYNKLAHYSEIRSWFFKLKPKIEQDEDKLLEEIRAAGSWILRTSAVSVNVNDLVLPKKKGIILCPSCGEAYPIEYGPACMGCQGKGPYLRWSR